VCDDFASHAPIAAHKESLYGRAARGVHYPQDLREESLQVGFSRSGNAVRKPHIAGQTAIQNVCVADDSLRGSERKPREDPRARSSGAHR